MQFFDTTLPVVATLFGFIVMCLLLAPPLLHYKGKISESSILLRLVLLILFAFGMGTTIFASLALPGFPFMALFLALPVIFCSLSVKTVRKEIEKW